MIFETDSSKKGITTVATTFLQWARADQKNNPMRILKSSIVESKSEKDLYEKIIIVATLIILPRLCYNALNNAPINLKKMLSTLDAIASDWIDNKGLFKLMIENCTNTQSEIYMLTLAPIMKGFKEAQQFELEKKDTHPLRAALLVIFSSSWNHNQNEFNARIKNGEFPRNVATSYPEIENIRATLVDISYEPMTQKIAEKKLSNSAAGKSSGVTRKKHQELRDDEIKKLWYTLIKDGKYQQNISDIIYKRLKNTPMECHIKTVRTSIRNQNLRDNEKHKK